MKKFWLVLLISGVVLLILPGVLVFGAAIAIEESYPLMIIGLIFCVIGRWLYRAS